jgi:hypothetical protein
MGSTTVSEELRLGVFRNRVLRKIFGLTNEVTGECGRQHNETLYDLYSPNIWVIKSRRMRWAGHVAHMGKRGAVAVIGIPCNSDFGATAKYENYAFSGLLSSAQ